MPFDEFDKEDPDLRPAQIRAHRVEYLERTMRAIGNGEPLLPPRYELFPGAILHDLLMVWRQRTRQAQRGAPSLKSLFEAVYDNETIIAEKTFRNWFDGTSQIGRDKARACLVAMLDHWPDGLRKRYRFCAGSRNGCKDAKASFAEKNVCETCKQGLQRLVEVIFTFQGQQQDQIHVLPSPGYSAGYIISDCAKKDRSIVFPLDTATAHLWDADRFFDSFFAVEKFLKLRNKRGAQFIYVLKPYDLRYADDESLRQVTGEALYRTALERVARNIKHLSQHEISHAIKILVCNENYSDVEEEARRRYYLERILIPTDLRASFPSQSEPEAAIARLERYQSKQFRSVAMSQLQYWAAASPEKPDDVVFYLFRIPKWKKNMTIKRRQNPSVISRTLIKGADAHISRIIQAAAKDEHSAIEGWHLLGLDEFLSLPFDRTFGHAKPTKIGAKRMESTFK